MRAGDIVRFYRPTDEYPPNWKHGLLVEYNTWEKIARILWNGTIVSVRAENTELSVRAPRNT